MHFVSDLKFKINIFADNLNTVSIKSTTVDGNRLFTTVMSPHEEPALSLTLILVIACVAIIASLLMITAARIVLQRRKCKREESTSHEARYTANDNPVFRTDKSDTLSSTSSYASITAHSSNVETSTTEYDANIYETSPEDSTEIDNIEHRFEEPIHKNNNYYLEIVA